MTRETVIRLAQAPSRDAIWDEAKNAKIYDWPLQKYREWLATGKYPYLADVSKFMADDLGLSTPQELANLETVAYFTADEHRKQERATFRAHMEADGWTLLASTDQALDLGKRRAVITARFKQTTDWLTTKHDKTLRAIIDGKGNTFFLLPKKRARGLYANNFLVGDDWLFYKIKSIQGGITP